MLAICESGDSTLALSDQPRSAPVLTDVGNGTDGRTLVDLVRCAGEGDERAWSELVRRLGPMVLRVARRSGLNAADAADVHQATWVLLMRHADQVRHPERIGAWLATTARRQSQRVAQRASRQIPTADPVVHLRAVDCAAQDVEAEALHAHFDPALAAALERLPQRSREVLTLLMSDVAPSYDQVADATGLPVGSIGPIRMRALARLRRDLNGRQSLSA